MKTECDHDWKLYGRIGMKSWLGVSLLTEGCAKCGTVRRYAEGHREVLAGLVARSANRAGFVIVEERAR